MPSNEPSGALSAPRARNLDRPPTGARRRYGGGAMPAFSGSLDEVITVEACQLDGGKRPLTVRSHQTFY